MKIAVCEDEKNIAEKLAEYISDFMKSTYFEFSIDKGRAILKIV